MTAIVDIIGREILDSRGNPTVEVDVVLEDGSMGRAGVPSGASTGAHEAHEQRDGEVGRYGGKGVLKAVAAVNGEICDALIGLEAEDQIDIDETLIDLDGTANKSRLGANAILGVSLAVAKAASEAAGLPLYRYVGGVAARRLPAPMMNIINGGAHADNPIDIQEFMIMPLGAETFADALRWGAEVFHALKKGLKAAGHNTNVGDEGGFAPNLRSADEALAFIMKAIEAAGRRPGEEVAIALDVAASEFGRAGRYRLGLEQRELDRDGMVALLVGWLERYPIVSIEDPLAEDDEAGFATFAAAVGSAVQVVGDDLLVTDPARVARAAAARTVNALLVKPNQRGTLTETRAAFDAARRAGFDAIVSARSGETEDVTIVHLAAGWGADGLKVGAFARSERMAKWNEALRIEEREGGAPLAAWRHGRGVPAG
jgi:enolase